MHDFNYICCATTIRSSIACSSIIVSFSYSSLPSNAIINIEGLEISFIDVLLRARFLSSLSIVRDQASTHNTPLRARTPPQRLRYILHSPPLVSFVSTIIPLSLCTSCPSCSSPLALAPSFPSTLVASFTNRKRSPVLSRLLYRR